MAIVAKAYTTTIISGLLARASNVVRALDDLYDEFNGSIDVNNMASAGTLAYADQIALCDTAGLFTGTTVELALAELKSGTVDLISGVCAIYSLKVSGSLIQDYTLIRSVGVSSQQFAGHTFTITEPGTTASELLAIYIFGDSASKTTDEVGAYTISICDANVVSGIMGLCGGAVLFTSATSTYAFNATLLDTATGAIAIDFWVKPEKVTASDPGYLFYKKNAANAAIACYIGTCGVLGAYFVNAGSSYSAVAYDCFESGTSNEWSYIVVTQDSDNGLRLFKDSMLVGCDISGTQCIAAGTTDNFFIGCDYTAALPFHGHIANFRVRQKKLSQEDIDLGFATKYTLPSTYTNLDFSFHSFLKRNGNNDFIQEVSFNEILRQSATIYREGRIYESSSYLKLIGKDN